MAIQQDPDKEGQTFLAAARQAHACGAYEVAIDRYRCALHLPLLDPDLIRDLNNGLGCCLNFVGKFREAESYCRLATHIDSSSATAFRNLGLSLEGQGKIRDAGKCYLSAAKLDSGNPRATDQLEAFLGRYPESVTELTLELEKLRREAVSNHGGVSK